MKPNPIGSADLEVFFAVAEAGSFRRAAVMLEMSQPAVTLRVQKLEDSLGLRLFDRTTRRVSLTDAGLRLQSRSRDAMRDLRQLWLDLRDEAELKVGRVVLGAAPTVAASLLPPIIARFMSRHPGVRISLYDDFVGLVLQRLSSGAVDLAVVPDEGVPEGFDCEVLFTEEMAIVAPRAWALPARRALSFDEFAARPFVSMPEPSAIRTTLARAFEAAGHPFAPVFEANNLRTLVGLAREGIGMSVLPQAMLGSEPELVPIRVQGLVIQRRIALVTRATHSLTPAAKACCAMIRRDMRARRR
jgi:DNA-binding transcriptional LysR family regulator